MRLAQSPSATGRSGQRPVVVAAPPSRVHRRTVGDASMAEFGGVALEDLPQSIR